jgi:hypothetical protein
MTVAGCGGATNAPARAENSTQPPAPVAPEEGVPASASSAVPSSESALPTGSASAAPSGAGSSEPVAQPPKRRSAPIDIAVVGKHAGDAAVERVISGVRTGLQNCYEAGLESAPTAMGIVDFRVNITASGAIKKVESANPNTMPGSITTCMVGRFGALSFEPRPATTIEVKVTCRPNE